MASEVFSARESGTNALNAVRQNAKTQKFQGGYDSYLTHLQRSGGFSSVISRDYDDALLRHEKEGTLTPKERDALVNLKYRKRHMGV